MIVKEFHELREDNVKLYRTYSDQALKIRKVGTNEIYDEAIDIENAPYFYEETNEPIEVIEEVAEEVENEFINDEENIDNNEY